MSCRAPCSLSASPVAGCQVEIQSVYLNDEVARPKDLTTLELNRRLDSPARLQSLKFRCRDLKKLLSGQQQQQPESTSTTRTG